MLPVVYVYEYSMPRVVSAHTQQRINGIATHVNLLFTRALPIRQDGLPIRLRPLLMYVSSSRENRFFPRLTLHRVQPCVDRGSFDRPFIIDARDARIVRRTVEFLPRRRRMREKRNERSATAAESRSVDCWLSYFIGRAILHFWCD